MSNDISESSNNKSPNERLNEIREESPYKCNSCGRAFEDRSTFEQHQLSEHRDQQTI
jgi:transposase-like protein